MEITRRDKVVWIISIIYLFIFISTGVTQWKPEADAGLPLLFSFIIFYLPLSLIYFITVSAFGWRRFKTLEIAYIIGFLANWFFWFSIDHLAITYTAVFLTYDTLFFSLMLVLFYLIALIKEYKSERILGMSLKIRVIVSVLLLIVLVLLLIFTLYGGWPFVNPYVYWTLLVK